MISFPLKSVLSLAFVCIAVAAGFLLHKAGKPYPGLLFNLHKLVSVALIVLLVLALRASGWLAASPVFPAVALFLLGLSLLALLVSGGFLSLDKAQVPMLWVHRAGTLLFLVSLALALPSLWRAGI
ncbi:MAG: hypothetical protein R2751_07480 [Bacteroidales bacterium]